ncbi:TPA: XRE family transcriptional regulator, partial [Streptococcus agalactiae]
VMDCDYNYLLEESDEFLNRVYNMGGKKELEKARALTEGLSSLFAGGEISDEDKDAAFEAITRAYWEAKRENKKYGRKKKD